MAIGRCSQFTQQLAPFFRDDTTVLMKMIAEAGFKNPEVEDITIKVHMGPLDHFVHEDLFPDQANESQTAVANHIHKALERYMNDRDIEIPYGMHIAPDSKAKQSFRSTPKLCTKRWPLSL